MTAAPRHLTEVIEHLVDDHVGILHSVQDMRVDAGSPAFFHVSAQLCNARAFSSFAGQGRTSAAGVDRRSAASQVVTDAVALYCAALRPLEEEMRPVCPARSAAFSCVDPAGFALFGAEQYEQPGFPWARLDESTPVRWAPATDPLRGEVVFVPAAMVHLPYDALDVPGEVPIAPATSTGLACHWSPAAAAVAAVCDAVECDALAIAWQAQLALPHVRVETLSDHNYDRVERLEQTGASVTLLDARLDLGIPAVLAVLSNRSLTAPALVFAAGTDPDAEEAVRKSLDHLAHAQPYCQMIRTQRPRIAVEPGHARVVDQESHLNFWCDHANTMLCEPFFSSQERLEIDELGSLASGDPEKDLSELVGRIGAAGHRVLLADVTTPDVRDLGLHVTRAIVPGLHPLFYGYRTRALGGARLWEVPRRLGHPGIDRQTGDNPDPHPFSRRGVDR